MFEGLLQRTQETGVSEEIRTGNIRIVDHAEVPGSPVSPNIFNNILMALLGGLTLAIGLAFTFEYADDRIKNPDEMKKHLGLPFLGIVPALFDKNLTTPLIDKGAPNMFAESFRSIRTNVLFSSTDQGGRLVVVTSSTPGEGKTSCRATWPWRWPRQGTVCCWSTGTCANPASTRSFRSAPSPGLSNILVGTSNASANHTGIVLDTGALGHARRNPSPEPGRAARIKAIQGFCRVSDAVLRLGDRGYSARHGGDGLITRGEHGAGVLFVIGAEMTSRRMAQRAVEQLEMGQARFLGAVLNRVDLEHNSYYYSKYYRVGLRRLLRPIRRLNDRRPSFNQHQQSARRRSDRSVEKRHVLAAN